jgi:CxxC-x17-CxxC domain-containing protein
LRSFRFRKGAISQGFVVFIPSAGAKSRHPANEFTLRHTINSQEPGDQSFMDTFNDKALNCADCGGEFLFSKNEQAFYAERGFTNEPKRCKNCRDKRKTAREGNGGSRERQMVSVTCDSCGIATEVPFTPVSGKPVYCRDCYNSRRSSSRPSSWA